MEQVVNAAFSCLWIVRKDQEDLSSEGYKLPMKMKTYCFENSLSSQVKPIVNATITELKRAFTVVEDSMIVLLMYRRARGDMRQYGCSCRNKYMTYGMTMRRESWRILFGKDEVDTQFVIHNEIIDDQWKNKILKESGQDCNMVEQRTFCSQYWVTEYTR